MEAFLRGFSILIDKGCSQVKESPMSADPVFLIMETGRISQWIGYFWLVIGNPHLFDEIRPWEPHRYDPGNGMTLFGVIIVLLFR